MGQITARDLCETAPPDVEVVISDLNSRGANALVRRLRALCPARRVRAVAVDVVHPTAGAKAFSLVVREPVGVVGQIFADVRPDARIAREEIFGPVLSVLPFTTEDEAIRLANDTPFGLAGAVWTRDVYRGIRVLKQIRAGILWLNTYHPTYNEAPWGGYKQSGFGRELGSHGIEHYLETKQININLTDASIGWY
jgi:acyl-CoA reductase-like NAD-dependent aldehyde dehydrogenase